MVHSFFLVQAGGLVIGGVYRRLAEECADFFGINLCYDGECAERREGLPHAHVPESMDKLQEFGGVMWKAGEPRVLHFQLSRLGV